MIKHFLVLFHFCVLFFSLYAQSPVQTLDYFIQHGMNNSPLLKDYQNQLNAATVDSLLIRAGQRPRVDANAQILYAPTASMFGYDEAITNGGNYSGVVGISQYFLNGRDLKNKYEGVSLQKRSLSNASKISVNDLKRLITNQYLTAYADYSSLSFNKTFMKLMNDEKGIVQKLSESGIYKQTDYLSLLIEVQTQEISMGQMANQYYKDILLLNQLSGINDTVSVELSFPEITRKAPPDLSLSPLFMQYKIDSLKITNEKKAVEIRYLPKLNWFADAGLMSADPTILYQHFGTSAGINFTIPIYDGKQRKLEYQKLDFSEDTRFQYENYFKKQYNQQMIQLNAELTANETMLEQLKKQLITAEQLIYMIKVQLEVGNISITEFVNATKNYHSISKDIIQTKINILQSTNEINYLLQQ
jgi:outer membrane protein TolC